MGLDVDREHFSESDYPRFGEKLERSLEALAELLERPGFGVGDTTLGAELEVYLVGRDGRPRHLNHFVLAEAVHPRVALELDRFNLELNTLPVPLAGRPFSALGAELSAGLAELSRAAAHHDARIATIGILPTICMEDLESWAITDLPRYRALSAGLRRLRRAPFAVRIDGREPLELRWSDVTLEGANTALQLHLRVDPGSFARLYNASQLATAPVLAAAGNSPIFAGHRLWEETRVALFKQAVDARPDEPGDWHLPARVAFGYGWVREGPHELFAESVRLFPPLLPALGPERPLEVVRAGGVPELEELRLHHGTVWRWNRAVFDPQAGGHLRIEMRALPAGPSLVDMLANAAFQLGLTLGLAEQAEHLIPALPFEHAHRSFYRAAKSGLDAELLWPSETPPSPRPARARELVAELVPVARRGLVAAGVDADEAKRLLDVVAARAASGVTGAVWQRATLERLERTHSRRDALAALTERYLEHCAGGHPVHTWPLEET